MIGTLDHIPVLDGKLKERDGRALLIGGVARAFNLSQRNRSKAEKMLPRKDTDILVLDEGLDVGDLCNEVDVFERFAYKGNWRLHEHETKGFQNYSYWRTRNIILGVTLPRIDDLDLPPGLHIPDELFLTRMHVRLKLGRSIYHPRMHNRRLPVHLENHDPFDLEMLLVKLRRAYKGDIDGVINMDQVGMRPWTDYELHCISRLYPY